MKLTHISKKVPFSLASNKHILPVGEDSANVMMLYEMINKFCLAELDIEFDPPLVADGGGALKKVINMSAFVEVC